VASVTIANLPPDSVAAGTITPLTATLKDANGRTLSGRVVAWQSDNPAVASVGSATGVDTAVALGHAQITATSEGVSGSATINVREVSLARDVQPVFTGRCALSGCHIGGTTAQNGQDLSTRDSTIKYTVNVPSQELPAMMRIRPTKPDSSYLVHKIQGTHLTVGGSGVRMPASGSGFLSESVINIIRSWVAAGAQNN
jgi:hypothetical protein